MPSWTTLPRRWPLSELAYQGRVTAVRTDGSVLLPGAVAIVAVDDADQILLVRQYRHPVGRHLWEVPAGLLDSTKESPREAGERELFEEGNLRANRWDTLVDLLTTPWLADETIRVLLARDLTEVPEEERHTAFHEEADMQLAWVPLEEAVRRALAGDLENGITVAAVLAAAAAPPDGLRPATASWPARKQAQPQIDTGPVATSR